jgi:hypothetical protein
MDAGKALTLIFVGALLIYLSIFGVSGFGFRFAVTNPENYLTYTKVDPNNHITIVDTAHLIHVARMDEDVYLYRDLTSFSDFTHKVQIRITVPSNGINWPWAVVNTMPWKGFDMPGCSNTGIGIMFYDFSDKREIRLYFGSANQIPQGTTFIGTSGVTYYITITKSGMNVKCLLYTGGFDTPPLVGTLEANLIKSETYRYVLACATSNYPRTYSQTAEIGNLQLSGQVPPPGTGSLSVMGYADQTAVQFSAYYVGPSGQGPTVTVPTSGYTWFSLAVGTYTVYGTYNSILKNQPVTVVAGQTASATLTFAGTEPPPEPPDFLKWLTDMLNNPMVKTLFTIGGVGSLGIGFIGLVTGRKKPERPQYAPSYY